MKLISNLKKVISDRREEKARRTINQILKLNDIVTEGFGNCWKIALSNSEEKDDEQKEIEKDEERIKSIWEAYFLNQEGNLEGAFEKLEEAGIHINISEV